MNMRRWLAPVVMVLTLTLTSGSACVKRAPTDPGAPAVNASLEATLAVRGRQVINSARATLPVIEGFAQSKVITPADGIKVTTALQEVGKIGEQLANVLETIDKLAVTDPKYQPTVLDAFRLSKSILSAIQQSTVGMMEGTAKRIIETLQQVTDAVLNVMALLPLRPEALPS